DWEYPVVEGYPGHRHTPGDLHNFTLLVQELRRALGRKYELSFAAGGYADCILRSIEWPRVMPLVDRVNVMTYDLVNANSTVTGHLTPLFSSPDQKESADNAVRLLDSLGVAPEKIVIGAAFYARVWEGVRDSNNGLFQPGRFVRYVPYRDLGDYFGLNPGFRAFRDTVSGAPYSYSAARGLFATYDDPRSAALKTAYALKHHLGGIMFWEITGDLPLHGLLGSIDSVRTSISR
ncbi:MAG TPA: glycosyl hydrolase family 18 protein, partial [Bacteroidota bacterium]|nr:glycosyl hydrolase family 18 protein [Bacteroidota bacterium]